MPATAAPAAPASMPVPAKSTTVSFETNNRKPRAKKGAAGAVKVSTQKPSVKNGLVNDSVDVPSAAEISGNKNTVPPDVDPQTQAQQNLANAEKSSRVKAINQGAVDDENVGGENTRGGMNAVSERGTLDTAMVPRRLFKRSIL